MESNSRSPAGGGCLIFAGFVLGAVLGIAYGQASYGVVIGTLAGVLLALAQWLLE